MECKICKSFQIKRLFEKTILNKYLISYYQCTACGFMFTETPFWLKEAYESAITNLDIGLLHRNLNLIPITKNLVRFIKKRKGIFLDYAGGYGVFSRLMRDEGFNYYTLDQFCENIFAKTFDLIDAKNEQKFDLVSAFEVFEHLEDPTNELEKMLNYSDTIFFSTELTPVGTELHNWWYLTEITGQHISFYSNESLKFLAEKFGLHYYSNRKNLHLFSKNKFSKLAFLIISTRKSTRLMDFFYAKNSSLLTSDFNKLTHKFTSRNL